MQTMTPNTQRLQRAYDAACERSEDARASYDQARAAEQAAMADTYRMDATFPARVARHAEARRAEQAAAARWRACLDEQHALYVRLMAAWGYVVA